tara:strand:+ start:1086 stop:1607 length:522 start_codon:yes stop_codon:yes gene_type:complete
MELVKAPSTHLQTVCQPFDFDSMDVVQISGEMCKIMMDNDGLGLSANQVGLNCQLFVMRPLENKEVTKPFAVINPIIREVSDETINGPEGCLSYPLLFLNISRPKRLVAQFLDIEGKECIIEFTGIDARCFAHEYDHLQGIEFIERVSKLKLEMAKKKQDKLAKRLKRHGRTQ